MFLDFLECSENQIEKTQLNCIQNAIEIFLDFALLMLQLLDRLLLCSWFLLCTEGVQYSVNIDALAFLLGVELTNADKAGWHALTLFADE